MTTSGHNSADLRSIFTQTIPLVEKWIELREEFADLRTIATSKGMDWGQLKALAKAHVEDANDDAGDGKRVQKIIDKADFAQSYADMLGLGQTKLNENNSFAEPPDNPLDGVRERSRARTTESMADHKVMSAEAAKLGLISPEAHAENVRLADAVATKLGNGPATHHDDLEIPPMLRRY